MSDRSSRQEEQRLEAAAEATHVPPSRVRYFIRVGLVRPSRVEGRVPYFGEAELAQLRRIRRLRDDLGLNIAGIEVALRLRDEIEYLRRELGKTASVTGPTRTATDQSRDRGGSSGQL